jgi:hypothetical protein
MANYSGMLRALTPTGRSTVGKFRYIIFRHCHGGPGCGRYKEHLLNDRKLGMTTVSKHLSAGQAVYEWARLQGYASGDNPFKGLKPSKKIVRKLMSKRRPFTDTELLTVFGSEEFLKQRTTNPARYWIPLLCRSARYAGVRKGHSSQ